MSQIALNLEKYRLNSESVDIQKLFVGAGLDEGDIEDLDNLAMSRFNSKESDQNSDEYDKIDRIPFMKNVFPTLKQGSKAKEAMSETWKVLLKGLKAQLSKIQGLKQALERRTNTISTFKSNLAVVKKKKLKQEAYNYENLYGDIEALEKKNVLLEGKILKINKDLSDDLGDFSLTSTLKSLLDEFVSTHKSTLSKGLEEVENVKGNIESLK